MKSIYAIKRILSITIFVSGVAFYFLFATSHPLLHNHPIDANHHPNCSVCSFEATAFSVKHEKVIRPDDFFQVVCKIFLNDQESSQQIFCKKYSARAPPYIFV